MRLCSGVLLLLVAAASTGAQPAARLVLADVVADALAHSPAIAAAQQQYDAARERPAQARSLPDPMISAGYNSTGRPWPGAGLGSSPNANIGVMVSQQVPYPGKLDARAAIAVRDADAEHENIDAARLAVISRTKQSYYRLAYTYAVEATLLRNRDLLDTLLKVSEHRYSVGAAAQQDVIKAQTQLTILELQLERIRQERATREGELNALLARPASTPVAQPEDLALADSTLALDRLVAAATDHAPMLRRDAILVDRARLAVDAARREYRPDFGISGGYFNMGAMPPMYELRVDVSVPLQRARRAAAVAEQLTAGRAAASTFDAQRLDLQSRIEEDYHLASSSSRLARLYRDAVLPQARLALDSSMASYRTGSVDFLSVLTNFGTVLEYEVSYFDEVVGCDAAFARLEALTGMPLLP